MNAEMSISRGRIENIEETFIHRDSCGNVHDNDETYWFEDELM